MRKEGFTQQCRWFRWNSYPSGGRSPTRSRYPSPVLTRPTTLRLLITMKAAPNPSARYGKTGCVGALGIDPPWTGWIWLYPIHYRELASALMTDSAPARIPSTGRSASRCASTTACSDGHRRPAEAGHWLQLCSSRSPPARGSGRDAIRLGAASTASGCIAHEAGQQQPHHRARRLARRGTGLGTTAARDMTLRQPARLRTVTEPRPHWRPLGGRSG